ncbi:signal peptidase I [Porphyrobacter sp. AAP60]|uniref:signal peptidase I n=1 Tax=Porphyrobacter sp. AAP60 TaxID=1523423 RepID=UPI0006B9C752|nr:signal peptidase I [Porphyrobacter sp. AAP60]KPF65000.1 signal peptidase [Porphyrobacter sp. AAP60]
MDVKTQSPGDFAPAASAGPSQTGEKQGSFIWFVVKVLLVVLAFRVFVFSPFSIPSESMLPRLMNGDYLLAAKWPYGFSRHSLPFDLPLPGGRIFAATPERGDIVIFKHPVDGRDYIKRVIGLPGDNVSVIDGQLMLNGKMVPRARIADALIVQSANTGCEWGGDLEQAADGSAVCRYARFRETLPGGKSYDVLDFGLTQGDAYAPQTVPAGSLFVMGDNRDNSRDSRFAAVAGDAVGLVPQDLLVGRAAIIVWSTNGSAEWIKPWTWFSAARWNRIGDTL